MLGKSGGKEALLLLSGGLDSACCLSFLRASGFIVDAVFVDYGQPAAESERRAAANISRHYDCSFRRLEIRHDRKITAGEICGRNTALVFAALLSCSTPPSSICIGIHTGTPYFDCSEVFRVDLDRLIAESTNSRTRLIAPFISWCKVDVIQFAQEHQVPVGLTYSCETGNRPCGECLSCRDRDLIRCS